MIRRYGKFLFWFCILGIILCGCGGNNESEMYLKDPVNYRIDLFDGVYDNYLYRMPSNTQDICVVLNQEQYNTELVSASAAGKFPLGESEAVYAKNVYEQLPMASLTKLMTALLALKYGNMEDTVIVGDEVVITYYDAWLAGLKPGDILTMDDLMYITLIYSGNDGAAAIAAHVGGTVENFVQMMNDEAKAIGATSTHFQNPHGLDAEEHYTTVYDLYLIFNECLKYDSFLTYIGTLTHEIHYTDVNGNQKEMAVGNTNLYMNGTEPVPAGITVFGGKTGFTFNAHRCLAIYTKDSRGQRSISIILGAEDQESLYEQMDLLIAPDSPFLKTDLSDSNFTEAEQKPHISG